MPTCRMFRINGDSVQYAEKYWHNYMVRYEPSYMFTFGGGHDYMCNSGGSAYSNMDHDYNSPHVKRRQFAKR